MQRKKLLITKKDAEINNTAIIISSAYFKISLINQYDYPQQPIKNQW
jgi:hypothetical protein